MLRIVFFCEAVAFPHVFYSFESKLFDNQLLWSAYNSKLYYESIETFLLRVFNYTKEKHRKHFRTYSDLSTTEIQSIKKILSPIIEDKNRYEDRDTLSWLCIQNLEILDSLYKNPRIMLEGPPGSGKTTIAKAFIDKQFGKTGIYLCWNNLLMHYTKNLINERAVSANIEVTTFFKFFRKYNQHLDYDIIVNLDEEQFYALVSETLESLDESRGFKPFDFIVIDEAQDVFDRGLDLFINKLCGYNGKGLHNGNALVLYDLDQSYTNGGRNVKELADLMTAYFTHFKLNEVKRSAQNPEIRQLAIETLFNPNILNSSSFKKKFPKIECHRHNNLVDVKKHLIINLLTQIRSSDSSLKGEDCILLIESSFLKGDYKGEPDMHYELVAKDIEELNESNVSDKSNKLRYTSILKFKGLERKNVFLVITEPSDMNKYEIYVGITRAMLNVEINIIK